MLFGIVVKTEMKKSQPIATDGSPVQIREGGLYFFMVLASQELSKKILILESFINNPQFLAENGSRFSTLHSLKRMICRRNAVLLPWWCSSA